jgi:IS30 family transposase
MRNSPISQVDIENELLRLLDRLEKETEDFELLAVESSKKEARYKSTWAKEYLSASGAIKQRESWADYKLEQDHYEYKIAEAMVKSKRETLLSLRTSIDAMRTLNANRRAQV